MKKYIIKKVFLAFLPLYAIIFLASCSDFGTPIDVAPENMTLRQVVGKYYQNVNFVIGTEVQTDYLRNSVLYPVYSSEFGASSPDSVFSQLVAYPIEGGGWFGDAYRRFLSDARKQAQFIKADVSISSLCSQEVKADDVSAEKLETIMTYYMKTIASEIESNKDVIKWMDVVADAIAVADVKGMGYTRSSTSNTETYQAGSFLGPIAGVHTVETPWSYMGFETVIVEGSAFTLPVYIGKAFALANQYAPNVKKLLVQEMDEMNPLVWSNIKKTILALRSKGIRIDGLGWRGSVTMGWEKRISNQQQLSLLIDWCYLNNIEFYITGLEVKVSDIEGDLDRVEDTRQEQAETFHSISKIMSAKSGKGASGIWFGLFNGHSVNAKTMANIFDISGEKTPAYFSVSSNLMSN